jgi:hypothetical protein
MERFDHNCPAHNEEHRMDMIYGDIKAHKNSLVRPSITALASGADPNTRISWALAPVSSEGSKISKPNTTIAQRRNIIDCSPLNSR